VSASFVLQGLELAEQSSTPQQKHRLWEQEASTLPSCSHSYSKWRTFTS